MVVRLQVTQIATPNLTMHYNTNVDNVNTLILLIALLIMFWVVVQIIAISHIVHIMARIMVPLIITAVVVLAYAIALGTPLRLMEKTMIVMAQWMKMTPTIILPT